MAQKKEDKKKALYLRYFYVLMIYGNFALFGFFSILLYEILPSIKGELVMECILILLVFNITLLYDTLLKGDCKCH